MSSHAFFQGKPHIERSWIPLKTIKVDQSYHFHSILYICIKKNENRKKQLRPILSSFTWEILRTETGHQILLSLPTLVNFPWINN